MGTSCISITNQKMTKTKELILQKPKTILRGDILKGGVICKNCLQKEAGEIDKMNLV